MTNRKGRRARVAPLRSLLALAGLTSPLSAAPASAECQPIEPVSCADCFAVVIMPDTQYYTVRENQPAGAAHLDLVTRYVCQHARSWKEPSTGKTMPISMVLQLGDLVQHGDFNEPDAPPLTEWTRVDAAFDNLDGCAPPVPYLVTSGNHDLGGGEYQGLSRGFNTFFGTDRWSGRGRRLCC